jgi:hypothetical protein
MIQSLPLCGVGSELKIVLKCGTLQLKNVNVLRGGGLDSHGA